MTARRVLMLLVAGVAVIAFAIWISSTRHLERDTLNGDPVLPGLEATLNAVTEVRLTKGDGTHATLKRGATGWSVAERGYPADSGKVRKLLLDLAELRVVEEKTRTPANYPLLGVENVDSPKATGTRVEAVTAGNTFAIIVGKSSSAKSGYVRVSNTPQSLLAAPLMTLDADPRRWLDPLLLDIAQERIQQISVHPATGPAYTASRATKQQPDFTVANLPKGRELSNPAAADPVAGSLAGLALDDVQKEPASGSAAKPGSAAVAQPGTAGAAEPAPPYTVFRTFDGLQVDLAGHKDGTRTLISVTVSSGSKGSQAQAAALSARLKGWEFEIPGYKYDGLFRPLEELLKKPEIPKKAAKATKKP